MTINKKTFAVVLGDIDMLRPLGLAGIPCAVVADHGDLPRYSRFATKILEWSDPWKNPDELIETLIAFGSTQDLKPILFYESDGDLALISRNRDLLGEYFRFVVPDRELVEDLLDKSRFQKLAERCALPIPKAKLLTFDFTEAETSGWSFPLVVKPVTRRSFDWKPIAGLSKAVRIENNNELQEFIDTFISGDADFLVQELVPGRESEIESYHVYVDGSGAIACEFTGKKIRTYPEEFGQSCALTITDAQDVRDLGREITQKINLRGLAKLDFKRAPDGRLFLLEINPRFSLWHHLAAAAGLNIPEIVYCDLAGLPRPNYSVAKPGTNWCRMWYDVFAAREEGLSYFEWLKWALRCEAKAGFALDDPYPIVGAVLSRTKSELLSSWIRKKTTRFRSSKSGIA